jgi:hypothetical protein
MHGRGLEGPVHKPYSPYANTKRDLEREASPPTEAPPPHVEQPQGEPTAGAGDNVWAPPEDYFAPYLQHIKTRIQSGVTEHGSQVHHAGAVSSGGLR